MSTKGKSDTIGHTPVPWYLSERGSLTIKGSPMKHDRTARHESRTVARAVQDRGTWMDEAEANGRLIVAAVNNHARAQRIEAALKAIIVPLEKGWKVDDMEDRLAEARAALES